MRKPRRRIREPAERLWAKIQKVDGCWLWTGHIDRLGYGRVRIGGKNGVTGTAHRFMYELLVGPVPDGLTLDHLCRNRACCNPSHLDPVTQRENVLRGAGIAARRARQTHCIHGHEFTPENTKVDAKGNRRCRECARIWWRKKHGSGRAA